VQDILFKLCFGNIEPCNSVYVCASSGLLYLILHGTRLSLQELVEDFVFTASKVLLQCRRNQGDIQQLDQAVPVCSSPATIMATFELLIALVTGCLSNLRALSEMIGAMFYSSG